MAKAWLSIIGMGKAGARELNYISDVDVIYVAEGADELDNARAVEIATRLAAETAHVLPILWLDFDRAAFTPARIQALLRRARGLANQPTLEAAGLHLDESRQCVRRDGVDIQLTAAEFRLLRYFMLHPQQILSKSHLAEHLYDGETERDSNVLEVHVNHLRRKLGRSVIETRRGQGYRFGASPA